MKICGIIAEYNPFHNGHRYQIEEAKKITGADAVVVIMSGSFVQRGEPAIIDKWTRTQIALENGVDCVFELPVYFSTASAQDFSMGAVGLLERLGVDCLCFGSEIADIELLKEIANYIQGEDYARDLKAFLEDGHAYSKAMGLAIMERFGEIELKSNDYLGISYLSEMIKHGYKMEAHCIKRISNDYNSCDLTGEIASATAIRGLMHRRSVNYDLLADYLPADSMVHIKGYPIFVSLEMLHQIFNAIFIRSSHADLLKIRGMREGIENRIFEKLTLTSDLEHFISEVGSRRYSKNSISRLLINFILEIEELKEVSDYMDYVRILGFREDSAALKELKNRSNLTFFSNMARDLKKYQKRNPLIALDIKASRMYDLINPIFGLHSEFTKKIIMHK